VSASFDGFSRELPRFLRLLARNNEKAWFDSHRADYDDYYVEAAKDFVAAIGPALRKGMPGYSVRISQNELALLAGIFGFTPTQLARYRNAAGDPRSGKTLRSCIEKVKSAGGPIEFGGETTKRVPKGFDPDHQNADLLRHKRIHLGSDEQLPDPLFDERAVTDCMGRFRVLRPLVQGLGRNVA